MLQFFSRNKDPRIQNKVQLVSVHIPKTAGTSFRNILKQTYGEEGVIRLDINLGNEKIRVNQQAFEGKKLDKKVKVLHGHFSPELLHKYFAIGPEVPTITWLRHPVDRVISNYYYLEKRLKEELQEQAKGLNILSKMQRSLLEYAHAQVNRNRIGKFLRGTELEDLHFIGIQDYFSEDLHQMAKAMNWGGITELRHNITGSKYEVSEADRQKIAELNETDMALYEKALRIREQRLKNA
ncbi:MAG: sulfotransferase family 2 domain-containing protein [Bacteroidota bacterium]